MIDISSNPQPDKLNVLHAGLGAFAPGPIPDSPLDRQIIPSPVLPSGPMPPIAAGITFERGMSRYFREIVQANRAQKGQDFVTSLLRSCILPTLGDRPLHEITRGEIRELIRTIGTTRPQRYLDRVGGRTGRANSVHWYLRAFFQWAADEMGGDLIRTNPMLGMKQPYRDGERDRVLTEDEIRWFWQATGELGYPFGTIGRLLLLTGQRRSEIANRIQWQVNRSERLLTIPINKSRRPHIVPLSSLAMELLEQVPQSDPRALVFPGPKGKTIYSTSFREANKRIHKGMVELMGEELARTGRDPCAGFVPHWVFHDLRRTIATRLCELGHGIETVDRLLNHGHAGGGLGRTLNWTTRIYARYEAVPERRAAVEDFAKYVRKLVTDIPNLQRPISFDRPLSEPVEK
jgi:integrase